MKSTGVLGLIAVIFASACSSSSSNSDAGTQCGLGGFKCDSNRAYNCGSNSQWIITDCSAMAGMTCATTNQGAQCQPITADGGNQDSGLQDSSAQCGLGGFNCAGNVAYNCGTNNQWIITDCSAMIGMTCITTSQGAQCQPIAYDGSVDAYFDANADAVDSTDGDGGTVATFTPLPFSNATYKTCGVNGMSDDGLHLAGACKGTNDEFEAVIWVNGAITDLGHMHAPVPDTAQNSFAYGATNDGVVTGNEGFLNLNPVAHYWNNSAWHVVENPTTLIPAQTLSGISADGTVMVGNTSDDISVDGGTVPYAGGYSFDLTSGTYQLWASSFFLDLCTSYSNCGITFSSLTAGGTAMVGWDIYSPSGLKMTPQDCSSNAFGPCTAMLPDSSGSNASQMVPVYQAMDISTPPVRLPLPGGYPAGQARAIARDGSAIAGNASGLAMPYIAIYWDQNFVLHTIGSLGPDTENHDTAAYSVSNGGTRIVGRSNGKAFIYTPDGGLKELAGYLTALGLGSQLAGWELISAESISPDGHYIAGTGMYESNEQGYWVHLP